MRSWSGRDAEIAVLAAGRDSEVAGLKAQVVGLEARPAKLEHLLSRDSGNSRRLPRVVVISVAGLLRRSRGPERERNERGVSSPVRVG